MNILAKQKRQVLKKRKKALAKRDAEQAEGKEVPEEHEEVEVADVTEAPSEFEGPTENE